MYSLWKQTILPFFSLFTSLGTLICCAFPTLLVTLGAGAALAGLVSNLPWLVALSEHKVAVFGVAGFLLLSTGILRYLNRNVSCPADRSKAMACARMRRISSILFWLSVLLYMIGFFFAFIAVHVFF